MFVNEHIGELAALGVALLWAVTYIQFTLAIRRVGPDPVNCLRLLAALVFLVIAHTAMTGSPVPLGAGAERWGWLVLSGVLGFAVSDALAFRALLHLGAHRTALMMSFIPVFSALMAWAIFGERMTWIQILAALVTVGGIALVVSARSDGGGASDRGSGQSRRALFGLACAFGAVVCQSSRYILSVQGMKGDFPVVSTNLIQILSATVATWLVALLAGKWRSTWSTLRNPRALAGTVGGAFTGPFLAVTLSLVALSRAPVGIASTLMATMPVFLLPALPLVFKERITLRAIGGTAVAVAGVAVLFLS